MMECLLVDDETLALKLLEDNLKDVGYINIIGRCRTATEALTFMQTQRVDLLFCDIHMPGLSGLQLVKSLINKPIVIFVTAYEKFAIDGFELEVLDYLVKPVPQERFLKACQKAYQLFISRINLPSVVAPAMLQKEYLFVQSDYMLVKINFTDIKYVQGLKDYVRIVLTGDQKPILSRISLKAIEAQLPSQLFFRVHKSYLININYITHIRRGKIISADFELPLSDNYRLTINKMIGREIE
ncbi:LytTR family DNA-binding domain-containing protein [Mucilaginibacter sp. UR6-11]|uniref:LytR/AlgR family response regulator transcription factor n=1 Tax=Mucilaginibacter sp. UR6-11 TaxID=1435644 RepID=UPI001E4DA030|nr:LytTR family DNA-binding domain-containing protein [Mucilaginibacter sp. UR6-11]MCC8426347.1 LytTR family DNA-binding domain-containing protein [Mucilaginibacter sp. UR6-11]